MGYIYTPFTSRLENCKVKILKGELHTEDNSYVSDNDESQVMPLIESTCDDGWGRVKSHDFFSEVEYPLPKRLKLRYISKMESRCYDIDTLINDKLAEELWKKQHSPFWCYLDLVTRKNSFRSATEVSGRRSKTERNGASCLWLDV